MGYSMDKISEENIEFVCYSTISCLTFEEEGNIVCPYKLVL